MWASIGMVSVGVVNQEIDCSGSGRNGRWWVPWGILAIALTLRVGVAYFQPHPNYFWHEDTNTYWGDAESLLHTGRLASLYGEPLGLPILLVPFVFFGVPPFHVVLIWQSLLGVLTVWLAMRITARLGDRNAGLACGVVLAAYPPLLNLTRQLITETWFIFFLFLFVWLLMRTKPWFWLASGCAAGMACLVRHPGLGVVFVTACVLLAFPAQRPRLPRFVAGVVVLLLLGSALQSYSARKLVFFGQPVDVGTIKPVLGGYVYLSTAEASGRSGYLGLLLRDPPEFMRERAISLATLLSPWPFGPQRSVVAKVVILLSDLSVYVLALWGWIQARRVRRTPEVWLLLAPVFGLVAFYGLLFSQPRYRWQFMPFLICVFAVGWGVWRRDRAAARPGQTQAAKVGLHP